MSPLARLADCAVLAYQVALRPVLPPVCRFAPSCSDYAREALRGHGFTRGSWLALRRICRCHPFHPGGFDPPPPSRRAVEETRS